MAYAVVASLSADPDYKGYVMVVGEKTPRIILREADPGSVLRKAGVKGIVQVTQHPTSGWVTNASAVAPELQCSIVIREVGLKGNQLYFKAWGPKGKAVSFDSNCTGYDCIQEAGQEVNALVDGDKVLCVWSRPFGWVL